MELLESKIKQLIETMGFSDFSVSFLPENSRFAIFINDHIFSEEQLPLVIGHFDCVIRLLAQKNNLETIFVDINNYRKKREDLIVEIARTAAKRSIDEKKEISLPAMNAYERRLIHSALSSHPDIKTESLGEGRERFVIVKPISLLSS